MRLALAVLALAGCSRVLGLDDIPIDQGALTVYGKLTTRRVVNGATRLPTIADDAPAGKPPPNAFVELEDRSRSILVWNADDTFYFDREAVDQPYRLVFPGGFPQPAIEYQLTGAQLTLLERAWGRTADKQMTASAGTSVAYTFTTPPAPTATGALFVDSSGLWTETQVPGTVPTNESFTLDWAGVRNMADGLAAGLLETIHYDRLYYVLYTASSTTSLLTRYRFDDLSLRDGATLPINDQPVFTVQPDTCVLVQAPRADEIQRITAAGYVDQVPAAGSWRLLAVPVLAMGPTVGFPLAYDVAPQNFMATPISFGIPFTGYDLALHMQVVAPHAVIAPGATSPVVVEYGSDQYILPQATAASTLSECSMQQMEMFAAVQLPTAPLLDGFPLSRDQPIQLDRTRLAKLTWSLTQQGGIAELYRARLFEVYADASLVTQLRPRAVWYTTNHTPDGAPQVLVDPSLFDANKSYVIEIADIIGQPGASAGDLATLHYPYTIGYAYTGVLQVTN